MKRAKLKTAKMYKARKGSLMSDSQAMVVGRRIEFLMAQKGGEVNPTDVIEDARTSSSPLHSFFEWDDTEAAKKYRLWQARQMIAAVAEVVVIEGRQEEHKSFFSVKNAAMERAYVTLNTVIKTPSYRQQLLTDAYSHIKELQRVILLMQQEFK